MSEKFCVSDEDKGVLESVLGVEAVAYFVSAVSNNFFSSVVASASALARTDAGLRRRLCQVLEGSKWNYAVFWQVAGLKFGVSALIWGDGQCCGPKGGRAGEGGSEGDWSGVSKGDEEELRKKVLQKLDAYFACSGSKEANYARLDRVSDLHMFYLASMYYIFGFDPPCGPGGSFKSGKSIWVSDSASCSNQLESRSFFGRLDGLQRIVFVPLKAELLSLVPWKQCQKTRVFWIWSGQHLVRVSCPLDLHSVSRVIKTLQEHQIMAPESSVSILEKKKIHTFSIRAQGSKAAAIQLKEKLEASLSKN